MLRSLRAVTSHRGLGQGPRRHPARPRSSRNPPYPHLSSPSLGGPQAGHLLFRRLSWLPRHLSRAPLSHLISTRAQFSPRSLSLRFHILCGDKPQPWIHRFLQKSRICDDLPPKKTADSSQNVGVVISENNVIFGLECYDKITVIASDGHSSSRPISSVGYYGHTPPNDSAVSPVKAVLQSPAH
jgi:hypothetical protein